MDHNLDNLDPERFQQLIQALLTKEYPGVVCLPVAQPDGGRDAFRYFSEGNQPHSVVYQIKFSRNPLSGREAREWVLENIDNEIEKVKTLRQKGEIQYILITNVPGTAHPEVGSIDRLNTKLTEKLGVPTHTWWRDDINRRLDGNWDIKLRYPEVLSGADFLRLAMDSTTGQENERRQRAVSAFLADQYDEDVDVKFKQVELHNKLLDLFVDLPFRLTCHMEEGPLKEFVFNSPYELSVRSDSGPGMYVIEDRSESQGGTATVLLSDLPAKLLGQVIVEGAPGQGKSTLAQYICQVHRIRWLDRGSDLAQLPERHRVASLRLPFKVDLRDLASWLIGADPLNIAQEGILHHEVKTLETFMAHLVRHKSGGLEFSVDDLMIVSHKVPLLIVLDGLDEVADLKWRADVVAAVSKAATRLRENCPDVRIVVTSRPAAFANSPGFDPRLFPHLELNSVTPAQVRVYAERWMDARNLAPRERIDFQSVLTEKMAQPHLRDLTRSPMQLAILLSLILTRGAALPDKRTHLYDTYVDLFFSREAAKNPVVRQNLELLKDIHRYLAWVLHSAAETSRTGTSGRITTDEFKEILRKYLEREEYSADVADQIFRTLLERVVMIVSRVQGTYEFEVQPLREYFAARYLYDTSPYSPTGGEKNGTKPDRFDAMARNPYWLNVTRFFCGCFSKGELLDLAYRVTELTTDHMQGNTRHPVSLAAMLVSDWVFAQVPRATHMLTAMLSERKSIFKLLPHYIQYGRNIVQIPQECGGLKILERTFEYLEDQETRADTRARLCEFIKANSTPEAVLNRWVKGASTLLPNRLFDWLAIGSDLGSLREILARDLALYLGLKPLDHKTIRFLMSAGRYDCLALFDTHGTAMCAVMLDSHEFWDGQKNAQGPLKLLPIFFALAGMWRFDSSQLHFDRISYYVQKISSTPESKSDLEMDIPNELRMNIASISSKVSSVFAERRPEGAIPTACIEDIIEDCRSVWGERRSIVASAISVAHLPVRPGFRAREVELFDSTQPICDRIRFARKRAKDLTWWAGQIQKSDDEKSRFILQLSFWAFAPLSIAARLLDAISDFIDNIDRIEWSGIMEFLPMFLRRSGRKDLPDSDIAPLVSRIRSRRLAHILGTGGPDALSRAIFLEFFVKCEEQSVEDIRYEQEFRQASAFDAATAGLLPWSTALSIIRTTYTHGACFHILGRLSTRAKNSSMPDEVVKKILENATDYPRHLWEMAETTSSWSARKTVRAVAAVAKKDRWFPDR